MGTCSLLSSSVPGVLIHFLKHLLAIFCIIWTRNRIAVDNAPQQLDNYQT